MVHDVQLLIMPKRGNNTLTKKSFDIMSEGADSIPEIIRGIPGLWVLERP